MAPPLAQRPPTKEQKPIVDLQVYEPARPPQPKRTVDPALFVPVHTGSIYYPPQWQTSAYQHPVQYVPNNIPIIKNYSINVSGPEADHGKVAAIYEDILPSKHFLNTANTIGERLNIYQFIRSVFVKYADGEDIDLGGNKENSLLRSLKFIELNPYNPNQLTDNPYKGLPDDMFIYRACYPIRFDKHSSSTQCASNSMGMNIRIYKMTVGEYKIKKHNEGNFYESDVWREIGYYEYVREEIIKKKQCPNFPIMHCYFIDEDCKIDFDKLKMIKGAGSNRAGSTVLLG